MKRRLITGVGSTIEEAVLALQDKAENWKETGWYPATIPKIFEAQSKNEPITAVALMEKKDATT